MSGGTFSHMQHNIRDIYETIELHIEKQGKETEWGGKNFIFEPEVLKHLQDAIICLKKAYVYAHRVDWLLAGDDGEESFIERLKSDLSKL